MQPLDPERVVFGQYEGYRDEDGVADDSKVETFVALEAFVDTERWQGVPFLLRTGKALGATRRTVTLTFRTPPMGRFGDSEYGPNQLVLELSDSPEFGVSLMAKRPGPRMDLVPLTFHLDIAEEDPDDVAAGGLRAAAARRDARRPDAVHPGRRGGPAVADLPAGSRRPAADAALRSRVRGAPTRRSRWQAREGWRLPDA